MHCSTHTHTHTQLCYVCSTWPKSKIFVKGLRRAVRFSCWYVSLVRLSVTHCIWCPRMPASCLRISNIIAPNRPNRNWHQAMSWKIHARSIQCHQSYHLNNSVILFVCVCALRIQSASLMVVCIVSYIALVMCNKSRADLTRLTHAHGISFMNGWTVAQKPREAHALHMQRTAVACTHRQLFKMQIETAQTCHSGRDFITRVNNRSAVCTV